MIYYRKALFGRGPKLTAVQQLSSCSLCISITSRMKPFKNYVL
jgi:hypothetical protein